MKCTDIHSLITIRIAIIVAHNKHWVNVRLNLSQALTIVYWTTTIDVMKQWVCSVLYYHTVKLNIHINCAIWKSVDEHFLCEWVDVRWRFYLKELQW